VSILMSFLCGVHIQSFLHSRTSGLLALEIVEGSTQKKYSEIPPRAVVSYSLHVTFET